MRILTGLIIFFLSLPLTLWGQSTFQGKVTDTRAEPVSNARVKINKGPFVSTNAQGEFLVTLARSEDFNTIEVQKEGLVIKDVNPANNKIKVVMAKPVTVKGRVLSDRSVPIQGMHVLLSGVRGVREVLSGVDGYFSITVPEGTPVNEKSRFVVYDPLRLKGTANYVAEIRNNNEVLLFVELPKLPVRRVQVRNAADEPVARATLVIDNIYRYTTDASGEAEVENAHNFSEFRVEGYTPLEIPIYKEESSLIALKVRLRREDDSPDVTQNTSTIYGKQVAVKIQLEFFANENSRIQEAIQQREALLQSGANISTEERRKIEAELQLLRQELKINEKAINIARENAQKVIQELEAFLDQEKEENIKTKAKLELTTREKEKAEENARLLSQLSQRNWLIFLISTLALASIITVFFVNYRKIRQQKNELGEKVNEINQKNEMLEESATIMDVKNKQIKEKNEQLLEQTKELEEKNKHITDSIRYAETLQQAILPDLTKIQQQIPEFFVFYAPKDIVSGDFYWYSQREDNLFIAAADCTGHGVSGAFMTMMGSAILNQVVNANQESDPVQILQSLNDNVKANLQRQQKTEEHEGDGMDIALLKINFTHREIIFVGAKSPLYMVKNGELMYYKGSNISIGTKAKNRDKQFIARCIEVEGEETIYLVTDGFQDQLGGIQEGKGRKKYMKTRFIDLLGRVSQLPIAEQKALLEKEFNDWKGDYPQTDDVMVIGFRIPPLPEKVSPAPLLASLTQFG